jgi:Putative MetA-pathway of phenol degradation
VKARSKSPVEFTAIFFLTFIATFSPAWAGPPFVTDDPKPVEYQRWEVNYALTETWRRGEASAGMPSIDINYGIVPSVQLHLQPRYSYERSAQGTRSGIDDTEIGVKYRFFNSQHEDSTFMMGIYPIFRLPTGNTKLGPDRGKGQLFLPLWVQRDSGNWTFYGGPGYRINPGVGSTNSLFLGGTSLYKVTDAIQLGGEIFHETPGTVDGKSSTGFNLGGTCDLARDYSVLFSAGKGLSNAAATNQLSIYLALQVRY